MKITRATTRRAAYKPRRLRKSRISVCPARSCDVSSRSVFTVGRYIPKPWSESELVADLRAALAFDPCATPSADELEWRRLEAQEPGITQVDWGPNGEVLMPGHLPTRPSEL